MQTQINPIFVIAALLIVVIGIGYFGFKAAQPPTPAAGSYTPGVPPWMDKNSSNYGKNPYATASQKH